MRRLAAFCCISWVVVTALACQAPAADESDHGARPMRLVDIVLAPDSQIIRAVVPQRATLASLLQAHDLVADEARQLVQTLSDKFDLRRFRAGQPYRLDRLFDGRVRRFEYEIDLDRRLIVRRTDDASFAAEIAAIPKTLTEVVVEGAISRETPSLTQAFEAAGERIELALALADVFSGELDFNNDLQPGDTFRLVVQRATREGGAFAGYGPVLAAEYVTDGRSLQAVRFTPPDGKPGYYDLDGRSLTRFFLKSPLKFEPRVTSGFSRARRHPVLNYTRAHNGVDYSAPHGAPVGSVAAGVVTFSGWTRGGGRTVKVRHAGGYESEYLHLSATSVRTGARVGQGEIVGRVGATGLVTGTHLHYGLKRNGAYVNPVREHLNMPPGEPIAAPHRVLFDAERQRVFGVLSASAARVADDDNDDDNDDS